MSVDMKADVPRSMTKGSASVGNAHAIGLVPIAARAAPGGATWRVEFTVCMPINPARAIIST